MKYKPLYIFVLGVFCSLSLAHLTAASVSAAPNFVRPCKLACLPTSLQAFTSSHCNALSTGDTLVLTDNRNDQTYRVRKFADGHCWMIDNMKLAGVTLTPADSDVTSNVTLSTVGSSGIWDGSAQSFCATASNFAADSTTRCGYHYNWLTATAGTGTSNMISTDAPASICPKGWKLPPNTGNGSFLNLTKTAGFTNDTAGSVALQNDTTGFSTRFFGRYNSGWSYMGSYGTYWSRSAGSATLSAYTLYFHASVVEPQHIHGTHNAFSVRCVL